jgi:hypothetical protein
MAAGLRLDVYAHDVKSGTVVVAHGGAALPAEQ